MTPLAGPVAVATTLLGLAALLAAVGTAVRGRVRTAAALSALVGAALLVGVLLDDHGHHAGAARLLVAAQGLAPLTLGVFPRVRWRHPVDFLALVALAGCALVSVLAPLSYGVLLMVAAVVLFAQTWWRLEGPGTRPAERRAVMWLALSVTMVAAVALVVDFTATGPVGPAVAIGLFALVPAAMYVGVAVPGAVDVRALVVRVAVGGAALVGYFTALMTVVSLVEVVTGHTPPAAVTALLAGVLAFGVRPLQVVLRGVIDELLFGRRPDPLDAAGRVVARIGDDPALALRAIREALVLPYAALRLPNGETTASGTATTETRTFPLEGGGELAVALRPGDLSLSADDEHVLRLTVPLLAQTLRSRALAAEVQAARGQTVAALEEERRRLRRDLHDGLGPRLSGIAFTVDAARNLVASDPAAADELLRSLRAETATAIADIRRLVYAMRPPALDELGLVPALRQQATGLRAADGTGLAVTLVAADLPELPAAVEVAAYRIVVEALTNVARHTASRTADVRLACADGLLAVEVTDRHPSTDPWSAGVGLASMRERAVELGGTLVAGPTGTGGRVSARLPLTV